MSKPSDFLRHSCNLLKELEEELNILLIDRNIDLDTYLNFDELLNRVALNIMANADAFDRIINHADLDFSTFISLINEQDENGELPK